MSLAGGSRPASRARWGSGWFLRIIAAVWMVGLAAYLFVWAVDPYRLRFPDRPVRLAEHAYPQNITARLGPAAASAGADVVILGGSTAMGYTPLMMRRVFADAKRPANLSFPVATSEDLALILARLEQSPSLNRVIINLDCSLVWRCVNIDSPLDKRYYAPPWYDPVPEFSLKAMQLSARVLQTGVVDIPEWSPREPDRVDEINRPPALTTVPEAMARITGNVLARRQTLALGPELPCEEVSAFSTAVLPIVRRLAARGVHVDLVAPPYSLALYSDWTGHDTWSSLSPAAYYAKFMVLPRCAFAMTAGTPNVRFHTFNTDLSVVGDLSLYRDTAHIHVYETYDYMLRRIADGDVALAPGEWPGFEARFKAELQAYSPAQIRR